MKILIELTGEAAREYMKDQLSETMRRLIVGNEWACEQEVATEIAVAFKRSVVLDEHTIYVPRQ